MIHLLRIQDNEKASERVGRGENEWSAKRGKTRGIERNGAVVCLAYKRACIS